MNLISRKPVAMAEAKILAGNLEERKTLNEYFKAFSKAPAKDAKKLSEEISALNNLKIKEEDIVKITDFMPKTSEEVNKVFNGVSLSEEEINSIINIVKKY